MKTKLKCVKCGEKIDSFHKMFDDDAGRKIRVELKRLPFGLCPECFRAEYIMKYMEDPVATGKLVQDEIHRIARESVADSIGSDLPPGVKPFEYTCPDCGVMGIGIGNDIQQANALKMKPVCPECQAKRDSMKRVQEDGQSFAA